MGRALTTSSGIVRALSGGDRRSIGRANHVVKQVLSDPRRFEELFAGLSSEDPVVRVRAADVVEKCTVLHPEWLAPYKTELLGRLAQSADKEVRWHLAQLLPRLRWTAGERKRVYGLLTGYLDDGSRIVATCALQALVDLTEQAPSWRPAVMRYLQRFAREGTPAMRARARKLLTFPFGA